MTSTLPADKAAVRTAHLARRRATRGDLDSRATLGAALADRVLALLPAGTPTVACYVSGAHEPPTDELRTRLRERGVTVLLPVLLADEDLDWARDDAPLRPSRRGLLEPDGVRLGSDAATSVDLWVVPALAADGHGRRLGRGGGSYDRALARARVSAVVVALLFDGEVLGAVPVEPHDRPVDAVVTPARTLWV